MATLLSIENLKKDYKSPVLERLSFEIQQGESFYIVGPSGCGKSTLLALINGTGEADGGTITMSGKDITSLPPNERNIHTVFQDHLLFPHLTVRENMCFGLKAMKAEKTLMESRFVEMIDLLELEGLEERKPHQLSGGQKQRAAIGRSLISRPSLVLFDEALSNIDQYLAEKIKSRLTAFKEDNNCTFCFVSHNLNDAFQYGDRMGILANGNFAQIGSPKELYEKPNSELVAAFLGETNVIDLHSKTNRNSLSTSKAGKALIRPERLKISTEEGNFQGKIIATHFQGSTTRVIIDSQSFEGLLTAATTKDQSNTDLTKDNTIHFDLEESDIVFVDQ